MKLASYFFYYFSTRISESCFWAAIFSSGSSGTYLIITTGYIFGSSYYFEFSTSGSSGFGSSTKSWLLLSFFCSESSIWASCSRIILGKFSSQYLLTASSTSEAIPATEALSYFSLFSDILSPWVVAASSKNLFLRLFWSACIIRFWLVS